MATVTQTIAMTGVYVPYERPPEQFTLWSAIPRGLQSFLVPGSQLDLKAVNDVQQLNLTATLPPNFGYVMVDMSFSITQDRAVDWQANTILNFQNYYRAPVNISVGLSSSWIQSMVPGLTDSTRHYRKDQPYPAFPIIGATDTSGVLVVINGRNNAAAAAAAGTINAFISFWQFDLEQIRKFPINTAIPTHSR